jgi:hypothetical protein
MAGVVDHGEAAEKKEGQEEDKKKSVRMAEELGEAGMNRSACMGKLAIEGSGSDAQFLSNGGPYNISYLPSFDRHWLNLQMMTKTRHRSGLS